MGVEKITENFKGSLVVYDPVAENVIAVTGEELTNSTPIHVAIVDATGDHITSFGGGVQYTEGDTDASITGTAILWEDASNTLVTVSASNPLPVSATLDATGLATESEQQTQTTHLSAIETAVEAIQSGQLADGHNVTIQDGGNTITVDGTVTANLGAVDNAVLDDIASDTEAIKTAVETLDNAISGSEMQVDVVGSLPAGTNAIGKLTANSGVDIGDVTINNAGGASAVNIQDGGNTITVDGTVTANLSATDNAVLDNIDADTSAIQTATEAIQSAVEGTLTVGLPSGASTSAKQDTIISHVDGIEALLTTIDTDTGNIATSLGNIDNAVDGNYLNTNMNIAGTDVAGGAGAVSAQTQRVTTAYDTGWLTARARYTAAQTNAALVTAGAGETIIVKKLDTRADNANTNDTGFIIGFDSATTPTGADAIDSHPGVPAGGGTGNFFGESGISSQATGDDLRITSEDPGGNFDVIVVYKIVS